MKRMTPFGLKMEAQHSVNCNVFMFLLSFERHLIYKEILFHAKFLLFCILSLGTQHKH